MKCGQHTYCTLHGMQNPGHFWTAAKKTSMRECEPCLLQAFGEQGGERVVMAGTWLNMIGVKVCV
ncbi:MAG: hypothetical protein Ct9H300mP23_10950 [Nitrospinota bacterium]|nr:MAG: hypothetical protein Ct9H300mP23_10950 [Nitrospinota bacterium]